MVDMHTELRKNRILALIISLIIPVLSGYLLYCDLADDDLFASGARYENVDIGDYIPVPDCQSQLKFFGAIGSNALFSVLFPETNAVEKGPLLFFLSACPEQKPLVLRC